MFDPIQDILAFHTKFGLEYHGKPRLLSDDLKAFREKFLQEELDEYKDGTTEEGIARSEKAHHPVNIEEQLEDQLDALVDLAYVLLGTAHLQGFNFEEAWNRVHAANMAKVRADKVSDSKRGSTFDVVKPAGWTKPTHADLIADHAHK